MKILATSDLHGNLDQLDLSGVDVAVIAGDVAPLKGRGPWHIYDQVKWMRTKFADFCKKWSSVKIVFTPGNHDFFPLAREKFGNTVLSGKNLSLELPDNCTMLIDQECEVCGLKIYGTPWVPIISHSWAFEAEHDVLEEKFSKIPKGLDILVTHSPPRFNFVDVSLFYGVDSDRFGSHELADAIFVKEPKFMFCGHIHTGSHDMNKLGKTEVYNVSRLDEGYSIAYQPCMVEI